MKILILSNKSPWPPRDGGSAATHSIITGLTAAGASVSLLALNTLKHHASPEQIPGEFTSGSEYKFVNIDTTIKAFRLIRNLLFSGKPYTVERFQSSRLSEAIKALEGEEIDIIQIEGLAMTYYIPDLRRINGARIIFRPHNVESRIWEQLSIQEKNPLSKAYFRLIAARTLRSEIQVLKNIDGLAAITKNDLEWFKACGLDKPSIICPAGFFDLNQFFEEGKNNHVCFIGSLDWRPNIYGLRWFLKNVWPIVRASVPEAIFNIAGRNPSNKIARECRGKNISFHGEVDSSRDFIRDMQVLVVPLFSGSGLRMKIIEGMSMGKSIVATRVAAEGTEFHDGKDIFIKENADDFAKCIIELISNPILRKQTSAHAIENVRKNYNIFASAEKLLKFYSELKG